MWRLVRSGCVLSVLCGVAWAQEQVYRCGSEYTNRPEGTRICKQVSGGHVTVIIDGTHPSAVARSAPSMSGLPPGLSERPSEKVSAEQQRQRDQSARAVLEAELQRAQTQHATLLREWNQGAPDRKPDEVSQPLRYQTRVAQLRAALQRSEADVAGLQRELARLTN